jgi:8-oxo-dGTP pyrophosphatase MutT (NUDIX family)
VARRPDLVECWVFRVPAPDARPQYLLIRRAADRIFAGLWQCVTGGIEPAERVPAAALREVEEETGLGRGAIEGFYDLDQTYEFYDEGGDAVVTAVAFAVRVRPDAEPRLSTEHDAYRWATRDEALALAVWPAYAESIERIERRLLDPATARWFELAPDGSRIARRPARPAR